MQPHTKLCVESTVAGAHLGDGRSHHESTHSFYFSLVDAIHSASRIHCTMHINDIFYFQLNVVCTPLEACSNATCMCCDDLCASQANMCVTKIMIYKKKKNPNNDEITPSRERTMKSISRCGSFIRLTSNDWYVVSKCQRKYHSFDISE